MLLQFFKQALNRINSPTITLSFDCRNKIIIDFHSGLTEQKLNRNEFFSSQGLFSLVVSFSPRFQNQECTEVEATETSVLEEVSVQILLDRVQSRARVSIRDLDNSSSILEPVIRSKVFQQETNRMEVSSGHTAIALSDLDMAETLSAQEPMEVRCLRNFP